jgi:Histidine kinase-, DNA gyrase B-, and HSP90-like ATPase
VHGTARTTRVRFEGKGGEQGLTVPSGHERAGFILLENLRNAWRFTSKQPNAEIAFGVEEQEGISTHFVRDNGAGFDVQYVSKLFGALQRLHTTEGGFEGTGIGLAIVQSVVHRHEGRVWAQGKVGDGAAFYVHARRAPQADQRFKRTGRTGASHMKSPLSVRCVFRAHLGRCSGVTWAAIPVALGQGFRSTWAAIPMHLGTDSGALGQARVAWG